jgi:hypothetical protein
MTSRVLYFPLISVPENAWFTRVLLFWDVVGAIVPGEVVRRRRGLSRYMSSLVREELVWPIDPVDYAWEIFEAGTDLLTVLDRAGELDRRRSSMGNAIDVPLIHGEKMGRELAQRFVDAGVAEPGRGSWFQVEERTAAEFMTLLARTLGARNEMDPITDRKAPLTSVGVEVAEPERQQFAEALAELRMPVLEAILPGPSRPVDPEELRRFKTEHQTLLADFRVAVDAALVSAAKEDDPYAQEILLTRAKQELTSAVDDVSLAMRRSGWRSIVLGVLGAAVPVAISAVTGNVITLAGALPGLASTAYGAHSAREAHRAALGKPLAYATLAQARFA